MKTLILFALASVAAAQCPTPTPPPDVSATATSPYTVRFQINPATPPTVGYWAEREPEGGTFSMINTSYPRGIFDDTNRLLPGQTFCYRTRAKTAPGPCERFSEYSEEVMVTMPDGPMPYPGAPEPPTNLTATIASGPSVVLDWTAGTFPGVQGQTQVFRVERSEGTVYSVTNSGSKPATDRNVVSGHTYHYRVRAFNSFGWTTGMTYNCTPNRTDCGTAFTNVETVTIP